MIVWQEPVEFALFLASSHFITWKWKSVQSDVCYPRKPLKDRFKNEKTTHSSCYTEWFVSVPPAEMSGYQHWGILMNECCSFPDVAAVSWGSVSGGQSLVHPASLRSVLEPAQLRLAVLRPGEDDAVVQPVGLTLPELHQVGLHHVAAPGDRGLRKF